ncbi:phenylalanine--tRNA ligase subunit beta [Nitrosomonas supralitoralis]|uniref:Phenylalanine--tRNA ligase beta subunit n=1 Tax=Nitrosomonas supralitoralis TaxID=2116706 RepID=A0A2P7NVC0_9PROT|nr:phenylalanine--tRNA ligase subunit beta [Nitrosomonas supralitoralis]PSJ17375.1 phenylalanine--tRNA ligase subunit beta [Nitrosomonas supralitoralis]
MKFSEIWLRSFVNPACSSDELAHALTMAGIEVESVEPVASVFNNVVVAEILSVEKHPTADRLSVCKVRTGNSDKELLQIVCGAPNVSAGMKVPCALVGATLPGFVIKKTKLRGLDSAGMLCSAKELGINAVVDGLLLLPSDAPVGTDFRNYYGLEDSIFTLSLTPNRADCLGVTGVAREVSAITNAEIHPIEIRIVPNEIDDALNVQVIASDACPLYCGRVLRNINLSVPTPLWMIQRLERSGLRSINSIVDITNYVMLETGQPMHAFNLAKIAGSIQIRYALPHEKIQLLNGNQINLTPEMLLISDEHKPLALAGIMGGLESGVTYGTTDIFLESAFFSPDVISGKTFHLGFSSDSAYRFERGVDFSATRSALERASYLILTICGGQTGPVIEIKHKLPQRSPINVRTERVKRILGIDINKEQIGDYFKRLEFEFSEKDDFFNVVSPAYRFDLAIEEDFIEELARIHGYDHIPIHYPHANMAMLPESESQYSTMEIKQKLIDRDYQEVINYAFVDADWEADFVDNHKPVTLLNPIASQMNVMRSTLIGGLISNLQFNLNRKQTRVRLFEIGCCFIRDHENDCKQTEKIAGLSYGDFSSEQWGIQARNVDFYDIKADVEVLCRGKSVCFNKFFHPALHPGKSAEICFEDRMIGWMGELHPRWQKKYGLQKSTILFELDLDILKLRFLPLVKEISKFPPVRRDIAIIVDNDISTYSLIYCMQEVKSAIISDISLFDIYRGKGMESNKKSLAFRILLQDTEKTLTDEQAEFAITSLIKILKNKFGAELRN